MLRKGDTVTVNIAVENETELRVTVFPKVFTLDGERGEDRQALNTPLSVVATAEAEARVVTEHRARWVAEGERAVEAAAMNAACVPVR